jgi:hypothetical protein
VSAPYIPRGSATGHNPSRAVGSIVPIEEVEFPPFGRGSPPSDYWNGARPDQIPQAMRLEGKVAVIVGAGQSPGEGIGNGRATTLRFAQEGTRILAADRLIDSTEKTAAMVAKEGNACPSLPASPHFRATVSARKPSSRDGGRQATANRGGGAYPRA